MKDYELFIKGKELNVELKDYWYSSDDRCIKYIDFNNKIYYDSTKKWYKSITFGNDKS